MEKNWKRKREMNSEVSEDDLQQSYDWDRKMGFIFFKVCFSFFAEEFLPR